MRYLTLVYIIAVFHLPIWKWRKYCYLTDMPNWMQKTISIRNNYEREYCSDAFYWAKLGNLYIRKSYCFPGRDFFMYSRKHLLVWGK